MVSLLQRLAPPLSAVPSRGNGDYRTAVLFGPSKALTGYLPERMATLQERFPHVKVRVAQPLVDEFGGNDLRLAHLLADNVRDHLRPDTKPHVALVDHGSPIPEVTAVRNRLAGQLSVLLGDDAACVAAASMERREGDEYRFNEPLLENLLALPEFSSGPVILAMLFLSPGRHAGEGGDIAEICAAAEQQHPGLSVTTTKLVGSTKESSIFCTLGCAKRLMMNAFYSISRPSLDMTKV